MENIKEPIYQRLFSVIFLKNPEQMKTPTTPLVPIKTFVDNEGVHVFLGKKTDFFKIQL